MHFEIGQIEPSHDAVICRIIKSVGREFGAVGEGFGPSDPEVAAMSRYYADRFRSRYFIARTAGTILGGGGIAPFANDEKICELRKLFLLPEYRGLGIGRALTERCLAYARLKGFNRCYLDTLRNMQSAIALYEKLGFRHLDRPFDATIHTGCDVWMIKDL